MAATKYDFSIEQGSSFRLSLTYKDNNGNIIDLTNYCVRLVWKTDGGDLYTFNSINTDYTNYKMTIDGPLGNIILQIPASATNNYTFNEAKYDLELQSPQDLYNGGGKYTLRILYGTISIIRRFSQSANQLSCTI
jgi:hypothetical protein